MLQVPNLEVDHDFAEIRCAFASHGDAVDVAVIVADDLGDLGQRAGLVDRRHGDLRREALGLAFVNVPTHVQPAVRLVVERGQRRGLDRIDRDPLSGIEDADDTVARHGAAVRSETHRKFAIRCP